MDPGQPGGAGGDEEHVAGPEELFRAHLIEDRPRVHLGGDLEGDPGGEVGLDDPRDDVHGGALGRQDQVDPRGPGHLGEAGQRFLHIPLGDHHQIREFVDDDDDVGELVGKRFVLPEGLFRRLPHRAAARNGLFLFRRLVRLGSLRFRAAARFPAAGVFPARSWLYASMLFTPTSLMIR